jgi:hypothetical protein
MKFIKRILVLLAVTASACAHASTTQAPATQQAIIVSLPAALEPMSAGINQCAEDQPGIALFIDDTNDELSYRSDLSIDLGEPTTPAEFAALLASEDIVVILNHKNPLALLSTSDLLSIYTGQTTEWAKVGAYSGAIQVWDYPGSDPLHQAFDQAVLKGSLVSSMAYLAPTPSAMLESISSNPQAVGYLPRAWIKNDEVHALKLDADISASLHLPVLALAFHAPQGALRTFLACLQTGHGHTTIMQHYQAGKP